MPLMGTRMFNAKGFWVCEARGLYQGRLTLVDLSVGPDVCWHRCQHQPLAALAAGLAGLAQLAGQVSLHVFPHASFETYKFSAKLIYQAVCDDIFNRHHIMPTCSRLRFQILICYGGTGRPCAPQTPHSTWGAPALFTPSNIFCRPLTPSLIV